MRLWVQKGLAQAHEDKEDSESSRSSFGLGFVGPFMTCEGMKWIILKANSRVVRPNYHLKLMLFDCGVVLVVVKIMVSALSTKGSTNHAINFLFPIVMLSVYSSGFLCLFCFFFCVVCVFMATMENKKNTKSRNAIPKNAIPEHLHSSSNSLPTTMAHYNQ